MARATKTYDLNELYKKTDIVGDCRVWREPTAGPVPRLNKGVWGTAFARQFAYSQSGAEIRPRCDLRNICGNMKCVKMEHLTYELDRSNLLGEFMAQINVSGGLPPDRPDLGQCHLWTGCRDKSGYGALNKEKWGERLSHRWMFKLMNPAFDPKSTVNHRCNRGHDGCVNPAHLFQVSGETFNASNIAHAVSEKRLHNQKFTFAEAMTVRAEIAAGAKTLDLCEKYGCSKQCINDIKFNRTHKLTSQ